MNFKNTKIIDKVSFGIYTNEEIKKLSTVEIRDPKMYDKGVPRRNGLNDTRLGTIDHRIKCSTCFNNLTDCVGHYGHIDLVEPFYHYFFFKYIHKFLKFICFWCGRLLLKPNALTKPNFNLNNIKSPTPLCLLCNLPQPKYRLNKQAVKIVVNWSNSSLSKLSPMERLIANKPFSPKVAYEKLSLMNDDEIKLIGMDPDNRHPKDLIITALLVPPPCVRPTIMVTESSKTKGQDDLTKKLIEVIKHNNKAIKIKNKLINLKEMFEINYGVIDDLTYDYIHQDVELLNIIKNINGFLDNTSTFSLKNKNKNYKQFFIKIGFKKLMMLNRKCLDNKNSVTMTLNTIRNNTKTVSDLIAESNALYNEYTKELTKIQFYIANYFDSEVNNNLSYTNGTKKKKSIKNRLKGKGGRVRYNIMGKRVDFSARTVITPGSYLDIDEVGIPIIIALKLTIPEVVNKHNITELMNVISIGYNKIGGAMYIEDTTTKKKINLQYKQTKKQINLKEGLIIHRYLKDGDYVIFNRQPSLHKESMMAHRVKIVEGKTFRLNLSVTSPYNADFDGDEMNIHVPQSLESKAELSELLSVNKQLLSSQNNKPNIGVVQDGLVSGYILTDRNTFIEREDFMQLLMNIKYPLKKTFKLPPPAIMYKKNGILKQYWTGKQLISSIIPNINMNKCVGNMGSDSINNLYLRDDTIIIRNGELLVGQLSKSSIGKSSGSLIQIIANDKNSTAASHFLSDIQRLLNDWILMYGFSVGIKDCLISEDSEKKVNNLLKESFKQINKYNKTIDNKNIYKTTIDEYVHKITQNMLSAVGNIVQPTDKYKEFQNRLLIMQKSGSKGSPINIAQICGFVGQQCVNGRRINQDLRGKSLPNFKQGCLSPESHGFVCNSYITGLNPNEFFFHAQAGREGLVDTAVKTSTTGYIQRKINKTMESYKITYNQLITNDNGYIINFIYGGDGFDPSKLEKINLHFLSYDDQKIEQMYDEIEVDNLKQLRDQCRFEKHTIYEKDIDIAIYSPISINRLLIKICSYKSSHITNIQSPINYVKIYKKILNLSKRIQNYTDFTNNIYIIASIQSLLSIKFLKSLNLPAKFYKKSGPFDKILTYIFIKFEQSLISPGTMVGSLAAESISEPCTQLTLNTFHFAGVAAKNVTLGVPRIKELIDNIKKIKTPNGTIVLKDHVDMNTANDICNSIIYTLASHCILSIENINISNFELDEIDQIFNFITKEFKDPDILTINLNKNIICNRNIKPSIIESKISNLLKSLEIITTTKLIAFPTDKKWKLHIKILKNNKKLNIELIKLQIMKIHIQGYSGIKSAKPHIIKTCIQLPNNKIKSNHKKIIIETECASTKTIEKTSLQNIWKSPHVEWKSSLSNDPNEISKILGICAAIHVLYQEVKQVLSFDGNYVNHRHIMLLVDAMTFVGKIVATNRHGMREVPIGIIQQFSYEEVTTVIAEAGIYGKVDNMKGVSGNIMFGQIGEYGTGLSKLKIDNQLYKQYLFELGNKSKKFNQLDELLIIPKHMEVITTSTNIFNKSIIKNNKIVVYKKKLIEDQNIKKDNNINYNPYNDNQTKLGPYIDSNYHKKYNKIPINALYETPKKISNDSWRPSSPVEKKIKKFQYNDQINIDDIKLIINTDSTKNLTEQLNKIYFSKYKQTD
jgi:DNA-directed RNA polymerase II subunit RPB1